MLDLPDPARNIFLFLWNISQICKGSWSLFRFYWFHKLFGCIVNRYLVDDAVGWFKFLRVGDWTWNN